MGSHRKRFSLAAVLIGCLALPATASSVPTWLDPTDVSQIGQNSYDPQIASDANGEMTAIWRRYDGSNYLVQTGTRPAGGTWSTWTFPSTGQNTYAPRIAVNASGDAVAVWLLDDGSSSLIVEAATRPAGGVWSSATPISQGGSAETPEVVINDSGEVLATWTRENGPHPIVQVATRSVAGTWNTTDISDPNQDVSRPQVAIDSSGAAVAIWTYDNGSDFVVVTRSRSAAGSWGGPTDLSLFFSVIPQVAMDAEGNAVAVWTEQDLFSNSVIRSSTRSPGGTWSSATSLSVAGHDADYPQVVMDSDGDAVAVWHREDGSVSVVQSASRPSGGSWSTASDISLVGVSSSFPQIKTDAAGKSVAVWLQYDGSNQIVYSATRSTAGSWTTAEPISEPGFTAGLPYVAVDAAGNAGATWHRSNGTDQLVQVAGYDAAGPRLENLEIPASGKPNQELLFSVSPVDVWSPFQTTWSFGDGGTGDGTQFPHSYSQSGDYSADVTAVDAVGNSTTSPTEKVAITTPTPAPSPAPAAGNSSASSSGEASSTQTTSATEPSVDRTAPVLTGFDVTLKDFATTLSPKIQAARVQVGTRFLYRLSESAQVTVKFRKKGFGARGCPKVHDPRAWAARCRYVLLPYKLVWNAASGDGSRRFNGWIRHRRLPAGTYRLDATAKDAAGNTSGTKALQVEVLRRR